LPIPQFGVVGVVIALHAAGLAWLARWPALVDSRSETVRMHVRTIELAPPKPQVAPAPSLRAEPRRAPRPSPAAPAVVARPQAPAIQAPPVAAPPQAAAVPPEATSLRPEPAPPPEPAAMLAPPATLVAIPARFDADYLRNPPPVYPSISRRLGEEGRVLLLVTVSAHGSAARIELKESSGFGRLDAAAQDAVKRWRFVPAQIGDRAIEAEVIVPLVFSLRR
jgi:protein TonB